MNTTRSSNLYTSEERDFWIDQYNHSTVSEFDNLSSNLNGPRRSTVQKWIGPRQAVDFGLSAERILGVANFYNGKQETMSQIENDLGLNLRILDLEKVENLQWASEKPERVKKLEDAELLSCMIDETASKIVVQYNPDDDKLYGWSAMPRCILVRNICANFDFKTFFNGLKFQFDKKLKHDNFSVKKVEMEGQPIYYIGFAQFEQYSDYYSALGMSGKDNVLIEQIRAFPEVNNENYQQSIDKHFAEAAALERPRATYIHSLAFRPTCVHKSD